jgi:hypothetical protein
MSLADLANSLTRLQLTQSSGLSEKVDPLSYCHGIRWRGTMPFRHTATATHEHAVLRSMPSRSATFPT